MKQDSNHILNSNKDRKVTFEELHYTSFKTVNRFKN
jgi:hypothetical protein